jgi:hypothetical protein
MQDPTEDAEDSISMEPILSQMIMQVVPNEDAEDSISTEHEREDPDLNRTFAVRRKAAKRTLPWDLVGEELNLTPSLRPQAEDIRATKKPRLEEPLSASTDEVATKLSSHDTAVSHSAAADADHADVDLVKATRAKVHWTPEEDAKLTSAITNTRKIMHGKEYRIDWVAITALVPGRAGGQCLSRWHYILNCGIDRVNGHTGTWTKEEDSKLKDAVQEHGGKDWAAISALVQGRTKNQCCCRWHDVLNPSIVGANKSTEGANKSSGRWTEDEDLKLKEAVQTHGGTNWGAIAALVPGRTHKQCWKRWHQCIEALTAGREGKWAENEDIELKNAVQTHGGKNWGAISAMVPSRTQKQCYSRWNDILRSNDRANGRRGKWAEDEDITLKDAVQTYGGKNWNAIATLVPGRTNIQCFHRWQDVLDPSIGRASGRTGKWSEDEYNTLKDAVQTHGDKDWVVIALLVPGRTRSQCFHRWKDGFDPSIGKWTAEEDIKLKNAAHAAQTYVGRNWNAIVALFPGRTENQCRYRWHNALDPSIDRTSAREGNWTADEDSKLKDAAQTYGCKNWGAISVLVPGRAGHQCYSRWHNALDPSIDRASGFLGKWTAVEESKLTDAVQTYGGKNWGAIAALVPSRTKKQCRDRWKKYIEPNHSTVRGKEHGTLKKAPALRRDPPFP